MKTVYPVAHLTAPAGRPEMLQRFASALFGGDPEELKGSRAEGGRGEEEQEEEQDEDWILVECLGELPHRLP